MSRQAIIWFALVYGQLNAMAVIIVMLVLGIRTEKGHYWCQKFNLDSNSNCMPVGLVVAVVCLGASFFLSVRRLLSERAKKRGSDV